MVFSPRYSWNRLHRTRRRAFSLIEVMAVISVNAVLLGIIVAALASMGRADRSFTNQFRDAQTFSPLIARLREDIHAAIRVQWEPSKRQLLLDMPEESKIAYIVAGDRWERRSVAADKAAADGELNSAYLLSMKARAAVSPLEAAAGDLLQIRWTIRQQSKPLPSARSATIELIAAVGHDQRLLHE
jgi:prepilin-type N-terminal cleavage/methylation domain-containing protein